MELKSSSISAKCFVISAPSGAGKTTLNNQLKKDIPILRYSVSDTTRKRRDGEVDGKDYNFLPVEDFNEKVERGEYFEWANVHGNYYGTSKAPILNSLKNGYSALLDLDVQGFLQMRDKLPEASLCSIFILPPSLDALIDRIKARGDDMPKDVLELRLENAKRELSSICEFDYNVYNSDLNIAYREFRGIIEKEMGLSFTQKMFFRARSQILNGRKFR